MGHPHGLDQFKAGYSCCAGSVHHHAGRSDIAACQVKGVYQSGRRDDRRAVLIVMEYRYVHQLAQALFDDETIRCLDVLEVDAAECGAEIAHAVDECVDVPGVHLEVDRVDVGEPLEEDCLSFHHGLRCEWSEIPKAENGGAVGDHCHEIPAGGVVINCGWIFGDGPHRDCNTGGIGEAQVALRGHRLGWPNFNLARLGVGVKEKRFLIGKWSLFRHVSTSVLNTTRFSRLAGGRFP